MKAYKKKTELDLIKQQNEDAVRHCVMVEEKIRRTRFELEMKQWKKEQLNERLADLQTRWDKLQKENKILIFDPTQLEFKTVVPVLTEGQSV